MQHAIGDHALLADGRTAALLDPDGNVAWLCWPRVDSTPWLLGILDAARGGEFAFRPARADARLLSREYLPGALVLRSEWAVGPSRVGVSEALAWEGPQRLVRVARCEGPPVEMEARLMPALDPGGRLELAGDVAVVTGPDISIAISSWAHWEPAPDGGAVCRAAVTAGEPATLVLADPRELSDAIPQQLLDATVAAWHSISAGSSPPPISPLAERVLGGGAAGELLGLSGCVLIGLRQRDGGIVAAPTTSLPQWPGSSRTWDYRYAWLRDTALAGIALARLGHLGQAQALGEFIGRIAAETPLPALVRVDGGAPPAETQLDHLAGHGGAGPVRIGNAAADQPQLDVVGEVVELARGLDALGAMPAALRDAIPRLADWTIENWSLPDHGIWEVRGRPHHYTHSRLMAWVALTGAGALAGPNLRWRACAAEIARTILAGGGPLQLHAEGGGADAALALVPLVGFLPPTDPRVGATLDLILERLTTGGMVDRYEGQPDRLGDRCGPFLFPTFWMAGALERCGRDGSPLFAAAAASRGSTGLFGEVADPATGAALGNYPQVQSHAAFILAATEGTGEPYRSC